MVSLHYVYHFSSLAAIPWFPLFYCLLWIWFLSRMAPFHVYVLITISGPAVVIAFDSINNIVTGRT